MHYNAYAAYEYDEQGHRIKKDTSSEGVTRYFYCGDRLMVEDGPNGRLNFLYDEHGQLYGFMMDGSALYFYVTDCLGTILGIINESGTLVAKYNYSAFGKCTVSLNTNNIANINPFRFKGYYYDSESGMYYCHTRYFVPEWGRWLNADNPGFLQLDRLGGINLFAYCCNDPVNNVDPEGTVCCLAIAIISLFLIDTVVETTILFTDKKYSAENVRRFNNNGEVDHVQIPGSAWFNNPIALMAYSKYLHENVKNVDGSNYFTGDVYDIVGEWWVHNVATVAFNFGIFILSPYRLLIGSFIDQLEVLRRSAYSVDLGKDIYNKNHKIVSIASNIGKYIWKFGTFNILNWW